MLRGIVPLLVVLFLVAGLVVFLGLGVSLGSSGAGSGGVVRYGVASCSLGNVSVSVFAVYNRGELDVFYTVTPLDTCYSVVHVGVKPVRLGEETVLDMVLKYSFSAGWSCGQVPAPPMSGTYSVFLRAPPRKITVMVTGVSQSNGVTSTECVLVPSG